MRIEHNSNNLNFNPNKSQVQAKAQFDEKPSIFSDKNNNGIIDSGDFTEQEWESINIPGISDFFDGQKWTKALSNLFSRILNKENNESPTENEPITVVGNDTFETKSTLIFDDETRTLKIAQNISDDEYSDYKEIKYNDEGNVISTKDFERGKYLYNGEVLKFSVRQLSDYVETQGFKGLGERKYSDEEMKNFMNIAGNKVWNYEDSQKAILPFDDGSYVIIDQISGSEEIYDVRDKLISKRTHKDGYDEIENYDDQGILSRTIRRTVNDDDIVTDYIKDSSGNKYIYEYREADSGVDGIKPPFVKKVIILDDNDKPIKSYNSHLMWAPGTGHEYVETRTFEDGHEEKLNLDKNYNIIE